MKTRRSSSEVISNLAVAVTAFRSVKVTQGNPRQCSVTRFVFFTLQENRRNEERQERLLIQKTHGSRNVWILVLARDLSALISRSFFEFD